jgi:hypothetical protein
MLTEKRMFRYELLKDNKNADKLFKSFLEYMERESISPLREFTIEEISNAIPRGTAGVTNYSTYGFSIMSMFSNQKSRDYYSFQNVNIPKIFTEICNNNRDRDNYAWKKLYINEKCKINLIYINDRKQ